MCENDRSRSVSLHDFPRDRHGYVITSEGFFDPPTSRLDENGQGIPYAVFGFGAHMAELVVDTDLGTVRVLKVTAAHDVGRAINPTLVEGQIEGGVAQGLGMALMDRPVIDKTGLPGKFDFTILYAPDETTPGALRRQQIVRAVGVAADLAALRDAAPRGGAPARRLRRRGGLVCCHGGPLAR